MGTITSIWVWFAPGVGGPFIRQWRSTPFDEADAEYVRADEVEARVESARREERKEAAHRVFKALYDLAFIGCNADTSKLSPHDICSTGQNAALREKE